MVERVPLAEQLDEVRAEYTRRCHAYPLLVARGQMRQGAMEFKIARMAATHNTLAWLLRNADQIREWVQYTQKVAPKDEREQVADAADQIEAELVAMNEAAQADEVIIEAERLEKARAKALAEQEAA